jgi:hypothetical protein
MEGTPNDSNAYWVTYEQHTQSYELERSCCV